MVCFLPLHPQRMHQQPVPARERRKPHLGISGLV